MTRNTKPAYDSRAAFAHGVFSALRRVIMVLSLAFAIGLAHGQDGGSRPVAVDSAAGFSGEYRLGTGDVLTITIESRASYSQTYHRTVEAEIEEDGTVFVDLLGPVPAANLTMGELRDHLVDTLEAYIKKPYVDVEVKAYNSQSVAVFGETRNGIYPLSRPMRIAEFLASIGGANDRANLRDVQIIHADGSLTRVNLNKFVYENDLTENVYLRGGDMVIVPAANFSKVLILGEVKSPGAVVIDHRLNLAEAVAKAGGETDRGDVTNVQLVRYRGSEAELQSINLKAFLTNRDIEANPPLQSGDIIFVPRKGDALKDFNKILGAIIPALQTVLLIKALN